jgi:hypothetical protein
MLAGMRSIAGFLATAMVVAACGGDDGGIPVEDLGTQLSNAICDRDVRCGIYADVATCLAEVHVDAAQLAHSIAGGRIDYDASKAKACVDAYAARSCDRTTEANRATPQACLDAVRGTVADGGVCYSAIECVSGSCPRPAGCTLACCQSTCATTVAPGAVGQACPTGDCVDGAYCGIDTLCVAYAAAGAACAPATLCGFGLGCVNSLCVDLPNHGQPCPDGVCADRGDHCDLTTNTCATLAALGGTCETSSDCQRIAVCNASSVCEAAPALGQACPASTCAAGLFCNSTGTCEAPHADGAACMTQRECASRYCDQTAPSPVCAVAPVCG